MGDGMRSWITFAAGLVVLAFCTPGWTAEEGHTLAVASGEVAGLYYPEAGAVCRLVNRQASRHHLRCVVEPSAGSIANLAALRSGETQLAVVQSRLLSQAVEGSGPFARTPSADLRSLMSLHGESLVVLVGPGAKIKTAADLKGKRVNIGRQGSFQRSMAETLLAAESLNAKDFASTLEIDPPKVAEAICHNEIDAAFLTGLHPMSEVQEAIDDCGATLLPLKGAGLEAYLKANPAFVRQVIPAEVYSGADQQIPTFGVGSVLVTTSQLSADDAYEVVKAVYDNLPAFQAMHPLLNGLDRKQMAHDALVAPLHDGALRYYRENGLR